jgi:hypothetical protein
VKNIGARTGLRDGNNVVGLLFCALDGDGDLAGIGTTVVGFSGNKRDGDLVLVEDGVKVGCDDIDGVLVEVPKFVGGSVNCGPTVRDDGADVGQAKDAFDDALDNRQEFILVILPVHGSKK